MRVLYLPFFSNRNLGGCSIFNQMKVILRKMIEIDPSMFLYWPVPENPEFDTSAKSYLVHPRIKFVPVRALLAQEDEAFFFPERIYDLFNADTGKHLIDLVVCDKPRISMWLDAVINNHIRAVDGSVPFVNMSQFVANQTSKAKYENFSEIFDYAQIMGWYAHPTVWNSDMDRKHAMVAVRKWAQGHVVKRIMENSFTKPMSLIDCDRMDKFPPTRTKDGEVRIHYGSRFQSGYRYDELFEVVECLYQYGRNVKLIITTPNNTGKSGNQVIKQLKYRKMNFELIAPCPQEKFYEVAASCHILLYLGRRGGPSLSVREQAYMGEVVVLPKTEVNEEMFPGYPYMFSDTNQMLVLVRHLVDNYWSSEVQAVVEKYRKLLRETYGAEKVHDLHAFFKEVAQRGQDKIPGSVLTMVKESMEKVGWPNRMTYSEFRELVMKNSRIGRDIEINYTGNNRRQCVAALMTFGYIDEGQSEEPVYVRSGGVSG